MYEKKETRERLKIDTVQLAQQSFIQFSSWYTQIFHHRMPRLTSISHVLQSCLIIFVKVIRDAFDFFFFKQKRAFIYFNPHQNIQIQFEIHIVNQYFWGLKLWKPHAVYLCIKGIISAALTKCSRNDGFIPVNKNLW